MVDKRITFSKYKALYLELVKEYERQEEIYHIGKQENLEPLITSALAAMHTLQSVLERAGFDRLEEREERNK